MARPSRAADGAKPTSDKLRRLLGAAVTACALAVLAAGCARDAVPPTWTPSFPPTTDLSSETPSPTPTSTSPSVAYQNHVQTASPTLYQQAYDLYVQFFTYNEVVQQDGGADPLPPELAALMTGNALKKVTAIAQAQKEQGFHWDGVPTIWTVKVAQQFDKVPLDATIVLQACEATSGAELFTGDGTRLSDGSTSMVVYHYFMRYGAKHQLVIFDMTGGGEDVETCPF